MPLLILLVLLLLNSWLFSEVLVLLPLKILHTLTPPSWLIFSAIVLVFCWCFGE